MEFPLMTVSLLSQRLGRRAGSAALLSAGGINHSNASGYLYYHVELLQI